jgi:hypothetical protein
VGQTASWAMLDIRVPQGLSGRGRRTPQTGAAAAVAAEGAVPYLEAF